MECNLFPDLILLAVLLLVLGIKNKKISLQILSFVVFGLSSYSYGTAYLFLPVFIIGLLIYLIIKKEISIKKAIIFLLIVFIICLPMIIYVIINTFDLEQINFLGMTITKLKVVRYKEMSSVFSKSLLRDSMINLGNIVMLLVKQYDELNWNALPMHGMYYIVSIVFLAIGGCLSLKKYKKNKFNQIMNIWMISSIILAIFCNVNINRMNIIIIPCVYYIILGLDYIINKNKVVCVTIVIIYSILFVLFLNEYFKQDCNEFFTFSSGVKELVEYCEKSEVENVYCYKFSNEAFIYFLFYGEYDVNEYLKTVEYNSNNGTFGNIKAFGKYKFYMPEEIKENSLLILPKDETVNNKNKITINQFDIYKY